MSIENIILLSLIQGITEFLPVSSSAHLMLFPFLFHIADQGVIADVFAHIGSLLAVIYFYRKDVKKISLSLFDKKADRTMFYSIFVATLPILFVGAFCFFSGLKFRNPKIVIYTSILFGSIFYLADKFGKKKLSIKKMSIKNAFYIGMCQVLSIIPGVSRSGITSTCGLVLKYKREDILKFSFLLSIPTIILAGGAGMLRFIINPQPIDLSPLILIMVFSFFFSIVTIKFMMLWIKHLSFKPFAIYRILLGIFLYFYLK